MRESDLTLRYSRLLPFINILLGLLLMLYLMFLVRDIISFAYPGGKESKVMPSSPVNAGKPAGKIQEYEAILRYNPFGIQGGQLRAPAAAGGKTVSRPDVILIGTISGPYSYSYAIFSDKSGRQEVFRPGEPVFNGGKLKRVERDKVFIETGSGLMEVDIADTVAIKDVNSALSNASPSTTTNAPAMSDFIRNMGSGTYVVDQKKILHMLENPGQLMTDVRLQPNIANGRQEGYILREVRSGGIYQSLGLQNNDVLLRINEYNISNPDVALQAFTALRGMDRIQLDIIRNDSRMTMTYLIR